MPTHLPFASSPAAFTATPSSSSSIQVQPAPRLGATSNLHPVPAVAVSNMSFAYGTETVLENISFTVEQGDFLAFIGPNGGGKSTLLQLMLGLLPPTTGTVNIFGKPPHLSRKNIGYVPQFTTLRTDFPASVLEMVLMGAARNSLWGGCWPTDKKAKEKALTLLNTLGLSSVIHHPVGALSGGQCQRAMAARALMAKPEKADASFLLLLDEPTASIDPEGKNCFYDFLDVLRGQCTIIVVSHDLTLASPYFSHVALVNRTVTMQHGANLTAASLTQAFGSHAHCCPIGSLQRTLGKMHGEEQQHG